MLIDKLRIIGDWDSAQWPYSVPAVRSLAENGLTFRANITVLVGANGSGKSTILEAVASAYGMDTRGGHAGRAYGPSTSPIDALARSMDLVRTATGRKFTRKNAKGFFLRAETASGMLEFMTGHAVQGYGDRPSWTVSHGESYMQAILGRFEGPGLYLLDEAEGPLSFKSTLGILYRLIDLAQNDQVQIIYATHSPLVAAVPGAHIVELTEQGIQEPAWEELETVELWRSFLDAPQRFFGS